MMTAANLFIVVISFDLITDERYRGTYNYINHAPVPEDLTDVTAVADCFVKGVGHTLVDVVPYFVGGNVRGKN